MKVMRRKHLFLFLIVLSMGIVLCSPLVASAHETTAHTAAFQKSLQIDLSKAVPDLSHPVAMNYPCPGQPRTGIVGQYQVGSCYHPPHGVTPNLNGHPSCSSGPYRLTVSGHNIWYGVNYVSGVGSWVEYFWCPSPYSSTGFNWALGHEYPLSGCTNMYSGNGFGANMRSSTGVLETDGEALLPYYVCSAPSGQLYDFSKAGDGSLLWQVWMWGASVSDWQDPSLAQSPTYA
jgi:hypothetical protein